MKKLHFQLTQLPSECVSFEEHLIINLVELVGDFFLTRRVLCVLFLWHLTLCACANFLFELISSCHLHGFRLKHVTFIVSKKVKVSS